MIRHLLRILRKVDEAVYFGSVPFCIDAKVFWMQKMVRALKNEIDTSRKKSWNVAPKDLKILEPTIVVIKVLKAGIVLGFETGIIR